MMLVRRICRLAVAAGTVGSDPLPRYLTSFGATYVSDLRAAEIRQAAGLDLRDIGAKRIRTLSVATILGTAMPYLHRRPEVCNSERPCPGTADAGFWHTRRRPCV